MSRVVVYPDRPRSSFEIQRDLGRMPTRDERSAFSSWRSRNPSAFLCIEDAERAKAQEAYSDEYRYLPRSQKMFSDLVDVVGEEQANKIKALIDALIQERHE